MKELKGNIQKNNMKKLVLSAVLSMFCYCTNNAMNEGEEEEEEKPEEEAAPIEIKSIDDVLITMFVEQEEILKAKNAIKTEEGKIYNTIKTAKGVVQKKKVLNFIKSQFIVEKSFEKVFLDDIKKIEKYFHLKEKNDDDECTETNLTEIFWDKKGGEGQIKGINENITIYFMQIIQAEKNINTKFRLYYEAKKAKKGEVENVEDVVIEEIMQECCGKAIGKDLHTKFLKNLEYLCGEDYPNKEVILATIKRRITLDKNITEENFISFLKQKIGLQNKKCTKPEEEKKEDEKEEEKKEEEKKEEKSQIGVNDHLKPKGGCPCCDC